jgi:hypothetical protein
MNLSSYHELATKVAEVIDYIMLNELRVFPPEQYVLDNVGPRVALGASFNPMQMGKSLSIYESADTARRLSDALGGLPVVITRKQGLQYIIPLSGKPQFPKMVELPVETKRGMVSIGVQYNGKVISKPWKLIGHSMVVGKTRSGKSAALRLLAFQALRDGFQLAIADNDRATFPMLKDHPALIAPIAPHAQAAYELIERISAECDHRAKLFETMPGYPETLEEYNELAAANGREPLKPLLVILDELSNTIILSSKQKQLTNLLGALGMRTLKFGVHIVFAAHEFTKDQIGLIRPQCETILAFRNEAKEMSALMGCAGAERIAQDAQGRVVTNKWGRLQMYYLDKSRLGQSTAVPQEPTSPLTDDEALLVKRSLEEAGGKMTLGLLMGWGMGQQEAKRLVDGWEKCGWLAKDAAQGNARVVTAELANLVTNRQSQQTASNPHIWQQSPTSRQQTLNMGLGAAA